MSKTAFNVNRGLRLRQQASLPGDPSGGLLVHQDNKIWAYIDGSWVDLGSGGGGSGGLARTPVDDTDSPITGEIAKWYVTDTTNGAIIINMPDLTAIAPEDLALAVMRFSDCAETWGVNNVTLVPFSGQSIDGQAADEPFLLDVSDQTCWAIMESTSNWCIDTTFQPVEAGGGGGLARTPVDDTDSPITGEITKWYVTDTTNGAIIINMPDLTAIAPEELELAVLRFSDCAGTWGVNNVTLVPFSGQSINGQAADEPYILDVALQTCWAIMESTSNWCIDTTFQPAESTDNTIKNDITSPAYQFVAGDLNTVMQTTENSANNIAMTIPSGLGSAGDTLTVIKLGTGAISWVAGGGVTLNASDGLVDMGEQYAVCTAIQTSPDVWVLTGDRA